MSPFAEFLARRGVLAAIAICVGAYLATGEAFLALTASVLTAGLVLRWLLTDIYPKGGTH